MQVRHGETRMEREQERETVMLDYSAGSLHHVRHAVIVEVPGAIPKQSNKDMIGSEQSERSREIKVKFSIPCQRFPPVENSVHI